VFQDKIGLIVEGESDRRAFEKIFSNAGIEAEFRIVQGFPVRKFNALAREMKNSGCKKVLILRDTECKGKIERYEELKEKIRELEGIEVCFAQCSLESWLLADEEAVDSLLRERSKKPIKVEIISNPESIPKPKDKMNEIFRRTRGIKLGYIEIAHAPEIASRVKIGKLEEKCESFREMMKKIKN
jgi:5S rRNA maturation endonuclease (ribonuclease M5)